MILFQTTPDPASVVAGWIPVALTAVLVAAMVFLFFSMRKQMRRINIPPGGVPTGTGNTQKSAENTGG